MKSSLGFGLGRPVQRVLQGTHLIQRNLVNDKDSAVGGTSRNGTHRAPPTTSARIDEAVALPSPAVVLSARPVLRPPPTPTQLASTSQLLASYRSRRSTRITQSDGPGRASPVPAATIRTFRAPYAGESFTAAPSGSSPLPWPSPFATGLGTPLPHPSPGGSLNDAAGFT